jgi:hypothetical protein
MLLNIKQFSLQCLVRKGQGFEHVSIGFQILFCTVLLHFNVYSTQERYES